MIRAFPKANRRHPCDHMLGELPITFWGLFTLANSSDPESSLAQPTQPER